MAFVLFSLSKKTLLLLKHIQTINPFWFSYPENCDQDQDAHVTQIIPYIYKYVL